MDGFTRDFVQNGSVFLVLQRPNRLKMSELSHVELQMIRSNKINHVLPLVTQQIDDDVHLKYEICKKKMLCHILQDEQISLSLFYKLLYQIVNTIVQSRNYMLDPKKFILDDQYIFVQNCHTDPVLGLVYVPVLQFNTQNCIKNQLQHLVIRMTCVVKELEGDGIQRILHLCTQEQLDIHKFRQLLLELEKNKDIEVTNENSQAMMAVDESHLVINDVQQTDSVKHEHFRQQGAASWTMYVILSSIVFISILWRVVYLSQKTMINLIICTSSTVLLLLTITFCNKKKDVFLEQFRRGFTYSSMEEEAEQSNKSVCTSNGQTLYHTTPSSHKKSNDTQEYEPNTESNISPNEHTNMSLYHTTLLKSNELVSGTAEPDVDNSYSYYVERKNPVNAAVEKKELYCDPFIIGRSTKMAQWIDCSVGVSRAHVELRRSERGHVLKDLASANGTTLKGEPMIPHKSYPLVSGDTFIIAHTVYTYIYLSPSSPMNM